MMPAQPTLKAGRVYRTKDLARWSSNTPRLAKRLVQEGALQQLAHGLFVAPKHSRFGPVPPNDAALMTAFLDGSAFVVSGPERWNALGLGTTAMFASTLVYNTKRSGEFELGGRRFLLRRVAFPTAPSAEWFVIDLFENASMAATSVESLAASLTTALQTGRFHRARLGEMALRFGTRRTQQHVLAALNATGA